MPREQIFAATGVQFMQINTLYQLLAMRLSNSPLLAEAKTFLMMADLFNWLLTGEKLNERTNATTTQAFDPRTADWAWDLLKQLEIPTEMFCPIVEPGTRLGRLRAGRWPPNGDWPQTEVVVPGTHDTASAVVSVPAAQQSGDRPNWCYISSGTWSLMGVEIPHPVLNDRCRELNFTNEGGVGGTTRLLKNIAGLWLVQECRRIWNSRGANRTWQDLNRLSATAAPLVVADRSGRSDIFGSGRHARGDSRLLPPDGPKRAGRRGKRAARRDRQPGAALSPGSCPGWRN